MSPKMNNKRKRDVISDSDESDIFQEPKRKSSNKPQKTIRKKNSSDEDPASPPEVKPHVSETENTSENEMGESNDEHEPSRKMRKKTSKSSKKDSNNVKANFLDEELSSDDELYTFQCPTNFNIKTLVELELDMNENSEITDKDTGDVFSLKIDNHSKSITCALPSRKKEAIMMTLPVSGHISVLRDVQVPSIKLNSDKNSYVDFPDNLKVRHPLLGIDWKNHIHKTKKLLKKLNGNMDETIAESEDVEESSDNRLNESLKKDKNEKKTKQNDEISLKSAKKKKKVR